LLLGYQGIIRVRLLIWQYQQHYAPREAEWTRRDHRDTARLLKPELVEGKPTREGYCAGGCGQG
jgi:hypothetical protein